MKRDLERRLTRVEEAAVPQAETFLLCRKDETPEDALARYQAEGRTLAAAHLVGWEALSEAEWEAKFCDGEPLFANVDTWLEESQEWAD